MADRGSPQDNPNPHFEDDETKMGECKAPQDTGPTEDSERRVSIAHQSRQDHAFTHPHATAFVTYPNIGYFHQQQGMQGLPYAPIPQQGYIYPNQYQHQYQGHSMPLVMHPVGPHQYTPIFYVPYNPYFAHGAIYQPPRAPIPRHDVPKEKEKAPQSEQLSMEPTEVFLCPRCGDHFLSNEELEAHVSKSEESRPYQCTVCSQRFRHQKHLKRHMEMHDDVKRFQCDVCEKKFRRKDNLESHKRIHTGESPYECAVCMKKFKHQSALINHRRVHLDDPAYQCIACKRTFSRKSSLQRHIQLLHLVMNKKKK